MIYFTINEKQYCLTDKWEDINLSTAIDLCKAINSGIPKCLKDAIELEAKMLISSEQEDKDAFLKAISLFDIEFTSKGLAIFSASLISILSDCPKEVLGMVGKDYLTTFYYSYLHRLVIGVLHYPFDYLYKDRDKIVINGVDYNLPKVQDYYFEKRPMADRTAIEFAEIADLEIASKKLDGGKFEVLPVMLSIICRPYIDGSVEKYDERTCLGRADLFKELKMDIVWDVFFSLKTQCVLSDQNTALSLMQQQQINMEVYELNRVLGG